MVTAEVSGTPLQHVDQPTQMKTWSYWSSAGYNGDVWIGDANFVDHSHSAINVNFKVSGGSLREDATIQSCDAATGACEEASSVDVVTDSWMGMQASSLRLPIWELLNRSGTDLSRCVDRCSIGVELRFENRLWTSWLMSPMELLRRGRKGEVSLAVRVSSGNHHSALREIEITQHGNHSMIHTAEHGGAIIGVYISGEFGYADPGFFLAHVGALLGVLVFGVTVADYVIERVCCKQDSWILRAVMPECQPDPEMGGGVEKLAQAELFDRDAREPLSESWSPSPL